MAQEEQSNYLKEFSAVSKKLNYKQQAQFFLNAYWSEYGKEAETVYDFTSKFVELDKAGENGHSLDEFQSHRLLELTKNILTVIEMRKALKEIDIDTDNRMSLLEYCVWKYKLDLETLMTRPQGVSKLLEECEAKINEINKKIKDVESKRKKWEGQDAPESGAKKIAYDNDMKVLSESEAYFKEALDFARKKLGAAQKSKDVQAQGKIWWCNRDLEEAAKYAAPKIVQKKEFKPQN
jgi:hypothetical protein